MKKYEDIMIAEKSLLRAARIVSIVFTPFYIPLVAFIVLFTFSYLRILPVAYKVFVLSIVASFTLCLPMGTILLFQHFNKLTSAEMAERKRRFVPFLLTIAAYVGCLFLMQRMRIPWYMTGIILSALLMLIICVIVNLWWKLSEHMAGAGAVIGGLIAFSDLFGYNPLWWLCLFILVAGFLGSARIILRHHTLGEVMGGLIVGILCSMVVLYPETNYLFRPLLF